MCLEHDCCRCQRTKYRACDDAKKPENCKRHPRECPNAQRETSQRLLCALCSSMAEVSDRLRDWIIEQAAERLVTEGGEAEEATSPPAAEAQNAQLVQRQGSGVPHHTVLRDKRQPVARAGSKGLTAGATASPAADHDAADPEAHGVVLEYPNPRNRPLSGSTIGGSSTAPTARGGSSVAYKRQSGGRPQEAHASQAGSDVQTPPHASHARHFSNPNEVCHIAAAATPPGDVCSEKTRMGPINRILEERQSMLRTPHFHHPGLPLLPVDRSAEVGGSLSLSIGALKRTISSPTIGDITPQTRTAYPPSEATNLPPAYVRPRSEVGLPPLPLRENQDEEAEDTDNGENEEAQRGRLGLRLRPRPRSSSRGRSSERHFSSQEYLNYARAEFLRFS